MSPLKKIFLNDKNILALISINAIIIFLQGFPVSTMGKELHYAFSIIDDIISILFVIEVLVKGKHFTYKEYLKSGWNKFDVFLIFLSLPPLFAQLLQIHYSDGVSFLLVFRVFRVFKFFRFIQFFPQVEPIFRSIGDAMRASLMVLIGFFVFIFIMAIFSCYIYQDISPQYFGNPITSYYSMFKVFTIEGWNTIPDEMVASGKIGLIGSFFTKLFFVIILVLGGVIGLSIVNSIFVDSFVSDNNDELEEKVANLEKEMSQINTKVDKIISLLEHKISSKQNSDPPIDSQ